MISDDKMVRRYSVRPLPPTAFVPGMSSRADRPVSAPPRTTAFDLDALGADDEFRYGVDLFNHGFAWEAHEVWEPLWLAAPRDRAERALLHGLIHVAAAVLKAKTGRGEVARRFAEDACELLAHAGTAVLDAPALIAALTRWAHNPALAPPTIELATS